MHGHGMSNVQGTEHLYSSCEISSRKVFLTSLLIQTSHLHHSSVLANPFSCKVYCSVLTCLEGMSCSSVIPSGDPEIK